MTMTTDRRIDHMSEVLKNIGWDSGFRLPVANDENQKLEKELALLVLKKASTLKDVEDSAAKYNSLANHLKYVKQESQQNQNLLSTYKAQLETESHRLKIYQVEKDRINSEIKQINKEVSDIDQRHESKRTILARSIEKLEKIKAEVLWDAEAAKAWEDALKKRDEDNELLRRFSLEDQRKALELEAKRKNLQVEVSERQKMLQNMEVDIINYDQVLQRAGKIIKQMKEERVALVRQWQEAVKNLRNRDEDIKRTTAEIARLEGTLTEAKEKLNEEIAFLNAEVNNNKFLEQEIEERNFMNSLLRRDMFQLVNEVSLLSHESISKKNQVENLAHQLEKEQLRQRTLRAETTKRQTRITQLLDEIADLTRQNEELKQKMINASERTLELERIVQSIKKQEYRFRSDLDNLETSVYRSQQALATSREHGKSKEIELFSCKNTLNIIRKRYKKEGTILDERKQVLSNLELKVACLEAKLGNIEGASFYEEDIEIWNNKIEELENVLAEQNEVKCMLHNQLMQLQKETLRLVTCTSNDTQVLQSLKDKLQSFTLMIEGGIKQATAAKLRTQRLQVDENVLKLKVDKLNKAMNREDKEIYNLQKYRIELETVLKERQIEINAAKDILMAKKKNLDEDRGRLRADISLRNKKIDQLRNMYELALGFLGKDEAGNPQSMAEYKVRTAQEKYLLHQEGDEMEQKVRRAESEIVAMENTLKVVNMTNVSFKASLDTVDLDGQECKQLKELEYELKDHGVELREKRKILLEKTNELKKYELLLEEKRKEYEQLLQMLTIREETKIKMAKEEEERQDKIVRAEKHINLYRKNISPRQVEKYDKEIFIKQFQEVRQSALHKLADFNNEYPEVTPNIRRYFAEYHLELPKPRSSFSISSDSVKSPSTLPSSASIKSLPNLCCVNNLELNLDMGGGRGDNTSLTSIGSPRSKAKQQRKQPPAKKSK